MGLAHVATRISIHTHGLECAGCLFTSGLLGVPWVDVLLHIFVSDSQLRVDSRSDMFEHHRLISSRMSTHMQLTFENIARFSWVMAGMLSTSPTCAQESAREAHRAILTKSSASPLALYVAADNVLTTQLAAFCDVTPPTLLWHNKGAYKDLFCFTAARFLAGPDHVLDCERVHAAWQ